MDSADDMILMAEVAEAGSFTRAGLRLGMPKSTVSQRISQLEARLGLRLLNRSTRHVSLTSAGQVYLDHCRRIRAEAMAASIAMGHLKEQPMGVLRITCPEVTASHFMPVFLRNFAQSYARINVELIATNQPLDIIRERIDFAFRVGTVTGQDLILRRLSSIRRVLVAAPGYLETAPPLREPDDLLQHRCMLQQAQPEWVFQAGDLRCSVRPPAATISDSMGFLLQSAVAGNGIALLPAYVCQPALAANCLVNLLADWTIPPHEMMLLFPNLKNQSSAQAAFRAHISGYDFSVLARG
ncbi:LysR family transcriptional regulator [Paracoccus sp. MBLB3053]|uniref:LysR family transcriptional regulator n=1 Tax=Paracoccus aurantius TaxID=3073814 RepID=A0ABU2HXD1_9RHOB|nr:LysR family transcriptional regulator [Paracoccus sp. MBLB3053]MDS9469708.1 LysR family transcriptional regulator [Paracoccus sp. MBLB3053]